ncbi:glycosyltransferase family 2 protein [Candidatus Woesebacteria bacterium]|nr:glycosyltransferase family 2 protein [Candidatus Woesebacteria bacterium]
MPALLCTCLIPFYNENERVRTTLSIISKVPSITKVICINDGSTESNTPELLRHIATDYPAITLINLTTNQGKSGAIKAGLDQVTTPWVLLLDADLQNLSPTELTSALELTAQKQQQLDMVILRRSRYSWFVTAIRHDILMSGERIMRASDLRAVYTNHTFAGYQLEVASNYYLQTHHKRCFWVQTTTANTMKITKWGIRKSFRKYRDELTGYTSFAGVGAYLRQLLFFCHQPLATANATNSKRK